MTLDPLFFKTRTVILHDWSELTHDFLLSLKFSSKEHIFPYVLSARYWREKIYRHQNSSIKNH